MVLWDTASVSVENLNQIEVKTRDLNRVFACLYVLVRVSSSISFYLTRNKSEVIFLLSFARRAQTINVRITIQLFSVLPTIGRQARPFALSVALV